MIVARSPTALVIEIGGTTMRAGRFDSATRTVTDQIRRPSPNHLRGEHRPAVLQAGVVDLIGELGLQVFGRASPDVVAVAFPGPVDATGCALAGPTLMGSADAAPFDVAAACRRWWPRSRILVTNDLTAAGYRYVGLGCRDFCILTVGSGIGHKVFAEGRPLTGPGFYGGEIGHLRVDPGPDAPRCDCGQRGHLGAVASGRGTTARVRDRASRDPRGFATSVLGDRDLDPDNIDTTAIAGAFRDGDQWVREVVRSSVDCLGLAVAAIHLAVGVTKIIVVGGFALALGQPYRQMLVESTAVACWNIGQRWDEMIELGIADDDGAMIGLGLLADGSVRR